MPAIRSEYPSDLTDEQWKLIRNLIPKARAGGRPRTTDVRQIINAVFYINRTGCAWRYLPRSFPPWQTVYDYFSSWQTQGVWKAIHNKLVRSIRRESEKSSKPSVLIIDSQSARAQFGAHRGYDGFKKLRGRKRHIIVDTLGLIHAIKVHAANLQDRSQGHVVLKSYNQAKIKCVKAIYADNGYRGQFVKETSQILGFEPTMPTLPMGGRGKTKSWKEKLAHEQRTREVPKKRWIVERTFAWFNHYRRLSKDYERSITCSEQMIYVAMTQLMLKRFAAHRLK